MAYFIFLKYLRSLEEFRKNPHVKISPKSPPTNFKSLGIFKNQILFRKEFSSLSAQPAQQPAGPSGLSAQPQPFFPFQPAILPPPLFTGPRPHGRPNDRLLPPQRTGRAPPPGLRRRRTRGAMPPSFGARPPPPSTIKPSHYPH
jgi:hypothetical protein